MVAGSGLVASGSCWCRKVVAGSGLVAAGSCWCRKVIAAAGRWSLVQPKTDSTRFDTAAFISTVHCYSMWSK